MHRVVVYTISTCESQHFIHYEWATLPCISPWEMFLKRALPTSSKINPRHGAGGFANRPITVGCLTSHKKEKMPAPCQCMSVSWRWPTTIGSRFSMSNGQMYGLGKMLPRRRSLPTWTVDGSEMSEPRPESVAPVAKPTFPLVEVCVLLVSNGLLWTDRAPAQNRATYIITGPVLDTRD